MQFYLSRIQLVIMSIVISVFSTYANRILLAMKGEVTEGEVISFETIRAYRHGSYTIPYIMFMTDSEEITFGGVNNMACERGDIVPVIFNKDNPEDAFVYTFVGFWFLPLIYALVPIIVLVAIPLSFLNYKEVFDVKLTPFTVKKRKRPPLELQ